MKKRFRGKRTNQIFSDPMGFCKSGKFLNFQTPETLTFRQPISFYFSWQLIFTLACRSCFVSTSEIDPSFVALLGSCHLLALVLRREAANQKLSFCFHKIIVCTWLRKFSTFSWYENENVLCAWSGNERKEFFLEISPVRSLFGTDIKEFKSRKFATRDTFVFKSVQRSKNMHTIASTQLFARD